MMIHTHKRDKKSSSAANRGFSQIGQTQLKPQLEESQFNLFSKQTNQSELTPVQREESPEEEDLLQGKFEPIQRLGGPEKEELLQEKFEPIQRQGVPEEEELLQGKFEPAQRKANDTGMPDNLKAGIESLSGLDMSDVKVHHNSSQPAQLNALAYAQGTDIHVAPGQDKHLPHEAWHVAQQKQGRVQPTMSLNGQNINDDAGLEHEADVMGEKALSATQFKRR